MKPITYKPHPFQFTDDCLQCGRSELDHFWHCPQCETGGNGIVKHICPIDKIGEDVW